MSIRIIEGDCREVLATLPDASVHCCVTSPPYFGLRDYGVDGQMGLEATPEAFIAGMVVVFREVRRVLRDDGTLWLNIGDSYATGSKWGGSTGGKAAKGIHGLGGGGRTKTNPGIPDKNLIGIPWMLAFALRADGWYLRQDIIWSKPNPMPESVQDRCTKAHEYLFLLSKGPRYYYDTAAIAEKATGEAPGNTKATKGGRAYGEGAAEHRTAANLHNIGARETRNKRSVWEVATQPFKEAHFATFPPALVEPCILAGSPARGTVLDPFFGAGTTGLVADRLQRDCIGIELNQAYAEIARTRIAGDAGMFGEIAA